MQSYFPHGRRTIYDVQELFFFKKKIFFPSHLPWQLRELCPLPADDPLGEGAVLAQPALWLVPQRVEDVALASASAAADEVAEAGGGGAAHRPTANLRGRRVGVLE